MAKKVKCPACVQKVPEYMSTYGDFITLLLCFFIAIYRPTARSDAEMKLIMSAFTGSLGIMSGGNTLSKGKLQEMGMNLNTMPAMEKGRALSKSLRVATEIFKPEIKSRKVQVQQDERGLVISLVGNDNFAPGSARLSDDARRILSKAAGLLVDMKAPVRIEGHADEVPVSAGPAGERYETNWELSSQRAINVLRYLSETEKVDPRKMSAVSYGKFRPVSESNTPEGRALNRRVDIVILTGKEYERDYSDSELPGSKVPTVEYSVP